MFILSNNNFVVYYKTEYQYDELNRLVNTVKEYGSDKVSEIKNKYNLDGNLIEKTTLLNDIQTGKETFVYDGLGRVVQKSDADVPYEYIEYNRNSLSIMQTDSLQKQFCQRYVPKSWNTIMPEMSAKRLTGKEIQLCIITM